MGTEHGNLKTVSLNLPVTTDDLKDIEIGTVVYLNGVVYTAREGVYQKVIADGEQLPAHLDEISNANFHCSPAARQNDDGSFTIGAMTGTASFRFSKWLDKWFTVSGAKIIIGKGGMSSADYKKYFVPHGAIYLTTVGYGTGALLGRGIKGIRDVHWYDQLGVAQAMWMVEVENFGPFIADSDLEGNSLFERENAKTRAGIDKLYEGTKSPALHRYGETDDRGEEVI
ncbi:fumarate hydratase C-terminal domain-containing protein [Thalassospiraceae bacterium LMO-JJ14]|nr:fumarate hydratase C-terminal domain-containing protein [Thalassospiraceae bacterium LMO-JJ14]